MHKAALTILLICAVLPAALDTCAREPVDTLNDVAGHARLAIARSREANTAGEHEESLRILEKVLVDKPDQDHFLLRVQLGHTLSLLDRPRDAVIHYRKAAEQEPRAAEAWLGLGQTAYALQLYAEAGRALYQAFSTSDATDPNLLYYAGVSHLMALNAARAADLLEPLVSGEFGPPLLDWYRALISACSDLDDAIRGRRAVDGMLEIHAEKPDAWLLAFQQAASAGEYRQACVALTVKSYLAPLSETETLQLGDLYRMLDIPLLACGFYESALGDDPAAADYERLAATYLAAHETGKARALLRTVLDRSPSPQLWALLGDICYMEADLDGAYEAFDQCRRMDPQFGRAWLMLGYCALEKSATTKAREFLNRALTFDDQRVTAAALLRQLSELAETPLSP
jgi:tetratricopeptide (TPR) repeat protein